VKPRPLHAGSRSGFTIVEVLVALGILLFGMTAVIGMLTFGSALSRTALLRTSAAASSQAVVADLEETFFPMVAEGTDSGDPAGSDVGAPIDVVERAVPGMPGVAYTARAQQNPERPLEYRVDVEMTWTAAGVRRAMSFSTILVREIPFGERLRRRFVAGPGSTPTPTPPALPQAAPAAVPPTAK
jgi:hypothetical protein